ncbi:MAG: ANTAR domain-containing protein [Lachnospiraceae bacterium]|nr:ANTAR domain-containing protein [Lachnospiraceae bacterium]
MANVIVAFSKQEDAVTIRNLLNRNGIQVTAVCTTGAAILETADSLNGGLVICGYRFPDLQCLEIRDSLPSAFEMIVIASPRFLQGIRRDGVHLLEMPLKIAPLVNLIRDLSAQKDRRRVGEKKSFLEQSPEDREMILRAKALLMEKRGFTEPEAHRYMQKNSMDTSKSMLETAKMILLLYNDSCKS